jgi:2-oxoglutarate dehydrogenase E2 component (dihydrolipoamide succinyltransferase)
MFKSFIECDVTNIWNWRKEEIETEFQKREEGNTPILWKLLHKPLSLIPMINIALDEVMHHQA